MEWFLDNSRTLAAGLVLLNLVVLTGLTKDRKRTRIKEQRADKRLAELEGKQYEPSFVEFKPRRRVRNGRSVPVKANS